jgi:hypothetical protein
VEYDKNRKGHPNISDDITSDGSKVTKPLQASVVYLGTKLAVLLELLPYQLKKQKENEPPML